MSDSGDGMSWRAWDGRGPGSNDEGEDFDHEAEEPDEDEEWVPSSDPAPSRPWGLVGTDLVTAIATASGQSRVTTSSVIDAFFATIADTVAAGGSVTIPGWLRAERVETAARTGRNPRTGEAIKIPSGHRVKLIAGSRLRAAAAGDNGGNRIRRN